MLPQHIELAEGTVITTKLDDLINWSRRSSIWYLLFGTACCAIELMQTGGPRQSVAVFRDRWAKHVRVGCFSPNYQTFFTGAIAEILVYSRAMTPEEQDRVRAYLALKWELG